jgi:photosystem II stability/assembly factor-like uncharacterized protein
MVVAGVALAWLALFGVAAWLGISSRAALATASGQPAGAVARRLRPRIWENYYGVTILSSGRAIVVGDKGLVMISDDKGRTWTREHLLKDHIDYDLYSVAFTPNGRQGWTVGDGGSIFHSSDGGTTWHLQDSDVSAALLKVDVIDAQRACAVGDRGTVLCTDDGGTTWHSHNFKDFVFFDLAFTDPNNGWAVGEFGTTLHTADGGKTWTLQTGGHRSPTASPYFAIAFTNASNGFAFGLNGVDMVTTDGGQSWQTGKLSGEPRSIFAAATAPSSGQLFVGGADGTLGALEQGKFATAAGSTKNSIIAIALTPAYGLAVGRSGTILRTKDHGKHWSPVTSIGPTSWQARR